MGAGGTTQALVAIKLALLVAELLLCAIESCKLPTRLPKALRLDLADFLRQSFARAALVVFNLFLKIAAHILRAPQPVSDLHEQPAGAHSARVQGGSGGDHAEYAHVFPLI